MGESKEIVRRFYDLMNAGRIDEAMELCSPDIDGLSRVVQERGREPFRAFWLADREGFPDRRYEPVRLVEEGGDVAVQVVFTGTHTGTLRFPSRTIPPTGKAVRVDIHVFWRVQAGKLVECRPVLDFLRALEQLGLWPPAAARPGATPAS